MAGSDTALQGASGDALRAWEGVRASKDIQFGPVKLPEQQAEPGWLVDFFNWLARILKPLGEALGVSAPVLKWVLLAILAAGLLWLLWRMLEPVARIRLQRMRKDAAGEGEGAWAPERGEALALLEDADRLAAEGRYDEAAHLLLRRSVGQIEQARPGWLEPSSTAREIAGHPALPERVRHAFAVIAERVERSLFALRRLDAQDWQAARAAYADFALADLRAGSPA